MVSFPVHNNENPENISSLEEKVYSPELDQGECLTSDLVFSLKFCRSEIHFIVHLYILLFTPFFVAQRAQRSAYVCGFTSSAGIF